jgi:hypothetical protein
MGGEPTIPTWFVIAQLFATAAVFTAIGIQARLAGKPTVPWFAFAGIVAYVSVDERAHIRDQLVWPVRQLFGITSGPFVLHWVIPR